MTKVLLMGIPMHVFQYFGGQIPYNLTLSQYNALVQLSTLCQFNDAQLQWVVDRAGLIPYMSGLLSQHNNDPAWIDALKDVIDARIGGTHLFSWANMVKVVEMQVSLDLTEDQVRWVIENSKTDMPNKVLDQIFPFFEKHITEEDADQFLKDHLNEMISNPSYKEFISSSFGWPAILWSIGKELIVEKGIDIVFNLIPGFNKQDEIRDGIKALANGDWLEFTWEAAKIVVGQVPWVKALGVANQLRDMWKVIDKIDTLLGEIGEAAIERSWNILKNSPIKFSEKALKYVDDVAIAKLGSAIDQPPSSITDYRARFKLAFPELDIPSSTKVHHAVPQKIWNDPVYQQSTGITTVQLHSLENLRGISDEAIINGQKVHDIITHQRWAPWYLNNPSPTIQQVLNYAKQVDDEFGSFFTPPIR